MDLLEHSWNHWFYIQVASLASLASLAQLLPPCSPTWLFRHRTALCAELLPPTIVSASATASRLLLLAACVRSYATAALSPRFQQLPDCVHFGCSSPIASDSTAAPRLCLLQLQLPDCVHFDCYTPIASACSLTCSGRFQPMPNVLELSS